MGADEGMVVMVGADGSLESLDGTKFSMRSDGKLVSEGKKVFKSTGKVVTAEQHVLTDVSASVDESGKVISINGTPLAAGAKIVIHQVGPMNTSKHFFDQSISNVFSLVERVLVYTIEFGFLKRLFPFF